MTLKDFFVFIAILDGVEEAYKRCHLIKDTDI
jgi:hypothetical protein